MACDFQYAKANNKNIKYHNKNKEFSYLKYWNVNNVIWLGNVSKSFSKEILMDQRYFRFK